MILPEIPELVTERDHTRGQASARNLVGTTVTNVLTTGLGVVSGILAARLLGPIGRGELAAIQNWPFALVAFGSLGVMTATGYYCGRHPSEASRTVAVAWVFLLIVSLPVMAVGYWLMPWLLQAQAANTVATAQFMLLLVLIQFLGGLPYWVLQGLGRFKVWNAMRIQMPILWVIVLLVSAYASSRSASFVAYGYLVAMAVHNVTWIVAMLLSMHGPYRPESARLPALLRYGFPSLLATVPRYLKQRLDQLLMAALLPPHALGLYVVAVVWSGAFSALLISVSQVIFPRLAAIHDRRVQIEALQRTLRLSSVAAAVLAVLLFVVTPVALPLTFGTAFTGAIPAALVLVIAAAVAGLNQVAGEALRGMGLPRWPMVAEFVGLGFGVPLLLILLPHYQLSGAAVASLVSYSATLIAFLWLISRETGVALVALIVPRKQDLRYVSDLLLTLQRSSSKVGPKVTRTW